MKEANMRIAKRCATFDEYSADQPPKNRPIIRALLKQVAATARSGRVTSELRGQTPNGL
jgi:hypothetical protein